MESECVVQMWVSGVVWEWVCDVDVRILVFGVVGAWVCGVDVRIELS